MLATTLSNAAMRRATPAAAPLYLAIAVVTAVLFGPNRLSAADACAAASESIAIRTVLWVGWIVISLPVVRSLLIVPGTHWLRSLPVPGWWMWLVQTVLVVAAQAPWILLWGSGRGLSTGVAYGVMAAAAQVLCLVPAITVGRVLLFAAMVAAPLVVAPGPILLGAGLVILVLGASESWARAPESSGRGGSVLTVFRGPRSAALPATYLIDLWRGDSSRLVRALLISLVGSAAAWLVIRNNQLQEASPVVGAVMVVCCPTLVMSLAGIAGRCLAVERDCQWLLDVTSIGAIHRVAALCIAVSVVGLVLGAAIGAILVVSIRPGLGLGESVGLLGAASLWGAAIGLLLAIALRWGQGGSGRQLGGMLAVLAGTTVSAAIWREGAIPLALSVTAPLMALVIRLRPRLSAGS